jgi:lysine-specific demethylase 8
LTQDPTTVQWDQLLKRANALTDYCNEAILLHHFKLVPVYWRRMLMDAGLLQVLIQLRTLLTKKQSTDFQQLEPLVQKIMCDLDTCSVVSGSPGPQRRWIANTILDSLQTWLSNGRNCPPAAQAKPAKASNHDPLKYPIMRLVEPPSFEWFLAHCNADRPTPFIMPRGVIEHWPAFHQHPWHSMDYLLSVAADRVVPVEIGSQYTDHQWSQKMMRFADFIHHHIIQEQPTPAYLAQHDVFYQIPRLEQDIIVPDYCYIEPRLNDLYTAHTKDVIKNAWFGPKGTISPLHHDPYHNLLCQVVGSKYLKLISPQQSGLVYPREGLMSNTSQVKKKKKKRIIYLYIYIQSMYDSN